MKERLLHSKFHQRTNKMTEFENKSRELCAKFLRDVVFVDECAYKEPGNNGNAFNAKVVSDVFSKEGFLCTIFAPEKSSDISSAMMLFNRRRFGVGLESRT